MLTIESVLQSYGPIAFGVVALLAIWKIIVAPFLKTQREETKEITSELRTIAGLNRSTASALERSIEKLDRMLNSTGSGGSN